MPHALRLLFLVALGLPLAACGETPDPTAAPSGEVLGTDERPPGAGSAQPGVPFPELLDGFAQHDYQGEVAVLGRLAEPLERSETPVANRHVQGQTDTVRTWTYSGLELAVYDIAGDPKQLPQSIRLTSTDYRTTEGLTVGSSRAEVTAALGEPDRLDGGDLVYVLGAEEPVPTGTLRVALEADFVQALTWTFTID